MEEKVSYSFVTATGIVIKTYFGNKRIAIVTENPNDIVIPVLVREKDRRYESKPFSTMEGAIQ